MFGCLGLSAVSFIIHGVWKYGWALQNRRMSLDWMGVMALFNMIGAIAYAVRVSVSCSSILIQTCEANDAADP